MYVNEYIISATNPNSDGSMKQSEIHKVRYIPVLTSVPTLFSWLVDTANPPPNLYYKAAATLVVAASCLYLDDQLT